MSIEHHGGKWKVRWRDVGGRGHSRTFDRKGDAVLFDAELTRRLKLGTLGEFSRGEETLDDFFRTSWEPVAKARLSPETFEKYQYLYRSLIGPYLGRAKLNQITGEVLNNWQAEQLRSHGAGVVWQGQKMFSTVLQQAYMTARIPRNPFGVVPMPKVPHRERPTLPAPRMIEEIRHAIARRPGTTDFIHRRDALIVTLLGYAGLRPEEVRGLRWGDLRSETLFIQRVLVKSGFRDTKTRQHRSVRMLDAVRNDLEEARHAAGNPRPDEQVILTRERKPFSVSAYHDWREHVFEPTALSVGAGPLIPYDLRHTFASLLLQEGRSVVYVASQLGHDPKLTLGTYAHVIAELEREPRIDANELIAEARGGDASQMRMDI